MTISFWHQDPALVLKSTPPRAIRGFLQRERLSLSRLEAVGSHVIAVLAPTGFGKTSQLTHWRREALARGALALWLTLDAHDGPLRLVRGLAQAAQAASGRRGFGERYMQWLESCTDPHEAMTGWLAEVAALSIEVMLILDDVDRLPTSTRTHILAYLLGNAPANLRIVIGARPASALITSGALGLVSVTRVQASDLRFRMDETLKVLSTVMGNRCDSDAGVRLHELTEGWPLGVQLAVAALHRSGDLNELVSAATADIRRYFIDTLIDRQPANAVHLLVRLAQFDLIHPELCIAVIGRQEVAQELLQLQQETPVLLQAEGSEWMRLHPLARDVLHERLMQLPQVERQILSQRAATWLAAHEMNEEAAQQALLAGEEESAFVLVERAIFRMMSQGRNAAVLEWYDRLPPEELFRYPGFWAPTAWTLAMSERYAEAAPLVRLILAQPDLPVEAQFEAALITATVASFIDRTEPLAELMLRWPEPPPKARPNMVPVHLVSKAISTLHRGQPDQARLLWARITSFDRMQAYSPVSYGFADYGTGLSYLWEGRCALAELVLRPALIRAEERMDRRNPVACMLAALLAQACWEGNRNEEPETLLALRLDVLERHGLPDALLSAYMTLARMADHAGRQDQAQNLLEALRAIGNARAMPRLQIAAQCELVRQHARHARADTAQTLSAELDSMLASQRSTAPPPFIPWLELHAELARIHAALAINDTTREPLVLQALKTAAQLAAQLNLGREAIEVRLLHAEVQRRRGASDATTLLTEAVSLAQAAGMLQLMQDQGVGRNTLSLQPQATKDRASIAPHTLTTPSGSNAGMLTLKEREVLTLLSRNFSNKEIALAMGVGEQTIKWHVKNLFTKLNAGSRKHAVARAHMLGLADI